jgi:hypothetical protein
MHFEMGIVLDTSNFCIQHVVMVHRRVKVMRWVGLQEHNVHTKFCEIQLSFSEFKRTYTDMHAYIFAYFLGAG